VPNRAYRRDAAAVQIPVTPLNRGNDTTGIPGVALGFVEFDDMGELWESCPSLSAGNECQLSRVLSLIRAEKQNQCPKLSNCPHEAVVIVFVHGWKNNASKSNDEHKNLYAFRSLLRNLAAREQMLATAGNRPARPYVGVYMAWRGQVLAGDLFATFWNRRNAAGRIAGPAFSEAVYRILAASKQDSPGTRVVVVGHSFGARILENSISDTFVSLLVPNPNLSHSSQVTNIVSPET
jgi:pimeloyl-ACP methyl ester carboxylesterase